MRDYDDVYQARTAAAYTTSIVELKELAYYKDFIVRYEVQKNPLSTEEIKLMTKAYAKFAQLTNDKSSN